MNCERTQARLPDFLNGELADGEMLRIQAHTANCKPCYAEMHALSQTWEALGEWPEEEPSANLSRRFYTMLESYQHGLGAAEKPHENLWQRLNRAIAGFWPAQPLAQVALGAALGVLAWLAFTYRPAPDPITLDDELAKLRSRQDELTRMVSLAKLEHQSPSERLTGVTWTARLERAEPRVIETLMHIVCNDPSINVRISAVEALYRFSDQEKVRQHLITALMEEQSPLVQIALIDALVAIEDPAAAQSLTALLDKETQLNPAVAEKAREGLRVLR